MTARIEECPHAETCDCPLCPEDSQSLEKGCWFPDESICHYQKVNKCVMVYSQRKIASRTKKKNPVEVGYFTFAMLNQNCQIKKGIKGLKPDHLKETESKRIKDWLEHHPPIRILTREEREKLSERAKKLKIWEK